MRTLRLERTFDAVFVHDAIAYITTEDDLRATIETVAEHLRPGGAALLVPDTTRELFVPGTRHGGHDGDDGRSLRYLEWSSRSGSRRHDLRRGLRLLAPGSREGDSRRVRPARVRRLSRSSLACAHRGGGPRARGTGRRGPRRRRTCGVRRPQARLDAVREGLYPLLTNIRSFPDTGEIRCSRPRCSRHDSRRSGSSSPSTWTAMATRRPCVRSAMRSGWLPRPPCTRTSRTWNARDFSVATRRSRAHSSS